MANPSLDRDIIAIIRASYDKLTPTERIIADYFLKDISIDDLSSKTLTDHLYVSKASLSRFAKCCGFTGYREFVYQYKKDMLAQRNSSSFTQMTQKVIQTYQILFDRTQSLIDEQQLHRIMSLLVHSRRVYLYGSGSSGIAAREFRLRFMRLGMQLEAIDDYLLMRINSSVVQPDTLMIGMSISGTTKVILSSLRIAKERGARTILMTANTSDRLKKEFDEVLLIASDTLLDTGISISPQFPLLIMGDILFSYYLNSDLFGKQEIHRHTLEVLKHGRI